MDSTDITATEGEDQPAGLRSNFFRVTILFAIGHGAATTPLVYASSVLDPGVAYIGNAMLYIAMLFGALVMAIPVISMVGIRGALVLSMTGYCVYSLGFSLASFTTSVPLQGFLWISGSTIGGLAAALLWTVQGTYMAQTAKAISEAEQSERTLINAELATEFAFYYLLFEEISKISWSCLMLLGLPVRGIGLLFTVLAGASAYGLTTTRDLRPKQEEEEEEKAPLAKLTAAMSLWPDPRIWLLAFTNVTFGFSGAYMNGYFNAEVTSKELGSAYIGYMTAITVIVASLSAKVYGHLGQQYGQVVPITIGAVSFACIPLIFFSAGCCKNWGWVIFVFYILQGSGRAVYENTNKAVFADTFKDNPEGAFANQVIQMSLASGICFFLSAFLSPDILRFLILFFAVLTPIGYIAKTRLEEKSSSEETEPLLDKSKIDA